MKRKGFTLIELMIVIAIIGVLAAIALPHFNRVRERARQNKCWENSSLLTRMTELYNTERGEFPGTIDDLKPLLVGNSLPVCPSGGTYQWLPSTDEKKVHCYPNHGCASSTYGG
ncbi:MAG TPA: prepilin-type N-terminal cleavage/methylation domain-containing protein [Candidatus Ozemobacteraceae bacterium]|nr:prepilin-type N-terminal cleavage/methylation domain-containing protein [Candidatus Ozemobacteraceae bacterium]